MVLRSAVLSLVALVATLAISSTAAAAGPKSFTLRTATTQTPGYLVAKGTFRAGFGTRLVEGTVDDKCPADGYGVWMEVRWNYGSRRPSQYQYVDIAQETCKERPVRFRLISPYKGVKSVTLFLREIDSGTRFGDGIKRTLRP